MTRVFSTGRLNVSAFRVRLTFCDWFTVVIIALELKVRHTNLSFWETGRAVEGDGGEVKQAEIESEAAN